MSKFWQMVSDLSMIKVSIITPVYNQAKFIGETIRSVLNQDYPDIEYIILDDGSTDETQEVIKPFLDKLKYIRHANIGESRTVNKGYRQCNGDIVGVVNSDDPLFTSDAVTRIVRCFQDHPDTLAVYPDWVSIDEHGNVIDWLEVPQYSIENMVKKFEVRLGPGMFIKHTALESIGYRNESLKYTGDLDVSFRLALLGKITHVQGFLATHRVHGQAASSVAKGRRMATEVVRLSKKTLKSPLMPQSLLNEKRKILSYAYLVSACYTKMYGLTYFKSIISALFMDPALVKDLFWGSDRTRFVEFFGFYQRDILPTLDIWKSTLSQGLMAYKKIGPICYRAWHRLPMTLRDGIKQYRKKLWRICPPPVKLAILRVMRFLGFLV
jgi:glycosyltransferase involved in cell wall biosynthesis